ncbi:MAG: dihydropteroate synthase [Arcobacteraceae bacterium]
MLPESLTTTRIMGVINANDDSFFDESRFKGENAISKIMAMIKDGAHIIDIGGVSTKPGSLEISQEEELNRIKPICDMIFEQKLFEKVLFSIDSYTPKVIEYALKSGFTIVNDITGLVNDEIAKITAKYDATIIIMHMQGKPKDMQNNPIYTNVVEDVYTFFEQQIQQAKKFGINKVILDVGIGFGKTLEHNLLLLKNMNRFLDFGYEVLIAASRKSMIDKITPTTPQERLSGTLAIHLDSVRRGATLVRCHDVKEHHQALKVQEAINTI